MVLSLSASLLQHHESGGYYISVNCQRDAMDVPDAVMVKNGRLKSVVWNDFDRVKLGDALVAICRHCNKKLSGSSSSGTSHLRNHLIRCQRRLNHENYQFQTSKENRGNSRALAVVDNNIDHEQRLYEPLTVVRDGSVTVPNANGCWEQRRSQLDLARMIIVHGYPVQMVDHVGFRRFVNNLQPLFELVSSDRVEADCMDIYLQEKQKVYEELDKLPGKISISANPWRSFDDNTDYLCLTAHYIDDSWQLRRKKLSFISVDLTHCEVSLSEAIMACLMDWDIDRKLFSMTSDSHSANECVVHRIRDRLSQNRFLCCNGMLFDIACAANLLNLMVKDAIKELSGVTQKIRQSILYIRSSQVIEVKFNEMALQAGVDSHKCLCLDNPLQWDSTYFMLEAALDYRWAFSLLQEQDNAYVMCPTELEWERARIITGYLKHFVEVTNVFVKNKYPTANLYFSEICDIHLQLIDWCKNSDKYISSLAVKMKNRFDEYWEKCSFTLAVSAMLDPRFKMKLIEYYYGQIFGSGSSELIEEVFGYIKALYNEHSVGSPLASFCQVNGSMSSEDGLTGFDTYLNGSSQSEGEKSDLDKYLEEPLFPRSVDFNILNWWEVHTPRYPILAMMARNVLAIQMSKISPELGFSTGKRVVDREWSSHCPATLQALICAQDWISGVD